MEFQAAPNPSPNIKIFNFLNPKVQGQIHKSKYTNQIDPNIDHWTYNSFTNNKKDYDDIFDDDGEDGDDDDDGEDWKCGFWVPSVSPSEALVSKPFKTQSVQSTSHDVDVDDDCYDIVYLSIKMPIVVIIMEFKTIFQVIKH